MMISNQMEIMLYVDDVPRAQEFWESLGFQTITVQNLEETTIVEMATNETAEIRNLFTRSGDQLPIDHVPNKGHRRFL